MSIHIKEDGEFKDHLYNYARYKCLVWNLTSTQNIRVNNRISFGSL